MTVIAADQPSIIFMKVGRHAGEDLEEIIARKRQEFDDAGMVFWGYGGGTMHPIQRVQPFVRSHIEQGEELVLVMESILSRHPNTDVYAQEYSKDGMLWEPVPPGVKVRGSRYALVLGEVLPGDLEIDFSRYRVGIGPSAGRLAKDYVHGRVDKACLERTESAPPEGVEKKVRISLTATIQAPYAVLLR